MKESKCIFSLIIFLILIPSTFSLGVTPDESSFKILPDKEYSGEVCVYRPDIGQTVAFSNTNYNNIFASFNFSNNPTTITEDELSHCTQFIFKTNSVKNINESELREAIILQEVFPDNDSRSVFLAIEHHLWIDATQLDYKKAIAEFSGKLFLMFISTLVILSLLLYMMNKIRRE